MLLQIDAPADISIPIVSYRTSDDDCLSSRQEVLELLVTKSGDFDVSQAGMDYTHFLAFENPSKTPTLAVRSKRRPTFVRLVLVDTHLRDDAAVIDIELSDEQGTKSLVRNVVAMGFIEVMVS